MRNEVTYYSLEALQQYYTSNSRRRCNVIPELAVQTYCALKLQQDNWIILTEVCWESAVLVFGADSDVAGSVLTGRSRIDMIALPPDGVSPLFIVEIKRDAKINGLKKDLNRLSQLAAAWSPQRECTGILLLYCVFTRRDDLEKQIQDFRTAFADRDPFFTDVRSFSDPLNDEIDVHCAVGSCLATP